MNRSGSCEAAREELDAGEEDSAVSKVLGQPPVSAEAKSAGRSWKPFTPAGRLTISSAAADPLQCALELGPGIGAVGEDVAQAGKVAGDGANTAGAPSRSWISAPWRPRQQAAGVGCDACGP